MVASQEIFPYGQPIHYNRLALPVI